MYLAHVTIVMFIFFIAIVYYESFEYCLYSNIYILYNIYIYSYAL